MLLALLVGAAQVGGTLAAASSQPDRRSLDALAIALLTASALALLARRLYPVTVLLLVSAATFAYQLLDFPGGPVWFAAIAAFFAVQTAGRRPVGWAVLAVGYAGLWWVPLAIGRSLPSVGDALALAAWMLALVAVAEVVRVRRAYRSEVREREQEAELARAEAARRRRSEERLRIARDLHDVLAHNI